MCPRNCGANRISGKKGYCNSDANFNISSICIHKGEEPVLVGEKGICNVFFSHCNLQCVFCQNHQISRNTSVVHQQKIELERIVSEISAIYDSGVRTVGFVSGSHFAYHCIEIVNAVRSTGRSPIFVYNTNGFDKVETLRKMEDYIDIYLPDFKYVSSHISKALSGSSNYFEYASKAIKEMYRQKGSSLIVDDDGIAESGLIIRHLVLPGYIDESIKVLEYIASEISTSIHLSIMSQYYPTPNMSRYADLNRTLKKEEYDLVVEAASALGFSKGWLQFMESEANYRPNFDQAHPFEYTSV